MKMYMNIDFATHIYEVSFIPFLGQEAEAYQTAFENWYYEEVECHEDSGEVTYCLQQRSELTYEVFDIEVVLDWFKLMSPECEITVVACYKGREDYNKNLPAMCF